jgi:protein-disulfide isomerase
MKRPGATADAAAPTHADKSAIVRSNAAALFGSTHQVVLGNPQGDVTMVEFFDYNCGFCKRAFADMVDLIKVDPKLKVVLKEFPILGPGSSEAAKVAVAVRMQDPSGAAYLAFHQKLLGGRGQADGARALEVAREVGLNLTRLKSDMASEEVRATLDESAALARSLGVDGTPSYVVGENVVVGAVGAATLTDQIKVARN